MRVRAVGEELPGLIRDIHSTIAAGSDVKALAELAVVVHVHVTLMWLRDSGASVDLRWQAAALAQDLAERLGDATSLGGDVASPMHAKELATQFGEPDGNRGRLGFRFGPTNVGLWEMALALEAGEPDRTVSIAQTIQPERHPFKTRQSAYWMDYGRALARLPHRSDDAVMALRKAEQLFPYGCNAIRSRGMSYRSW